ncbi:MAG: NifU family protein [Actinomycetota bacterium]|nr:NifU family protein [Actinomycetota bacterium]
MQVEAVESALESLRPGLEADGFDLRIEQMSPDGGAVICIEARPGACMECLVPDEVLVQIIKNGISKHAGEVGSVSLVKRGFDHQ